jgi:hypothetical protein
MPGTGAASHALLPRAQQAGVRADAARGGRLETDEEMAEGRALTQANNGPAKSR